MKITNIVNNTIYYGYVDISEEDDENSSIDSDVVTYKLCTLFLT